MNDKQAHEYRKAVRWAFQMGLASYKDEPKADEHQQPKQEEKQSKTISVDWRKEYQQHD